MVSRWTIVLFVVVVVQVQYCISAEVDTHVNLNKHLLKPMQSVRPSSEQVADWLSHLPSLSILRNRYQHNRHQASQGPPRPICVKRKQTPNRFIRFIKKLLPGWTNFSFTRWCLTPICGQKPDDDDSSSTSSFGYVSACQISLPYVSSLSSGGGDIVLEINPNDGTYTIRRFSTPDSSSVLESFSGPLESMGSSFRSAQQSLTPRRLSVGESSFRFDSRPHSPIHFSPSPMHFSFGESSTQCERIDEEDVSSELTFRIPPVFCSDL